MHRDHVKIMKFQWCIGTVQVYRFGAGDGNQDFLDTPDFSILQSVHLSSRGLFHKFSGFDRGSNQEPRDSAMRGMS